MGLFRVLAGATWGEPVISAVVFLHNDVVHIRVSTTASGIGRDNLLWCKAEPVHHVPDILVCGEPVIIHLGRRESALAGSAYSTAHDTTGWQILWRHAGQGDKY